MFRECHGPLRSSELRWKTGTNIADSASGCFTPVFEPAVLYGWRTLTTPGFGGSLKWLKPSRSLVWDTGGMIAAGIQPLGERGPRSLPTATWLGPRPFAKEGTSMSFCGGSVRGLVRTGPASLKFTLQLSASSLPLPNYGSGMHLSRVLGGRHRGLERPRSLGPGQRGERLGTTACLTTT